MKKILYLVISLILLLFLTFIIMPQNIKNKIYFKAYCITLNYKKTATTKTLNKKPVLFQIQTNESILNIINSLQRKGIIGKDQARKLTCLLNKKDNAQNIKAGYFIIAPKTKFSQLIRKLQNPEQAVVKVTIPEGLRIDQIALVLDKALHNDFSKFSKSDFLHLTKTPKAFKANFNFLPNNISSLEGFLFPDTYEFNKFTTTSKQVIETMLKNFQKKALPLLKKQNIYDNQLNLNLYKKLIIASIIERETNRNLLERRMVADIIYKRLINQMPLQIDATLLYPKKDWTYTLTYKDIHEDNPYNTYTRKNLPPTPICNPGLSAIIATNAPKQNPYFYYLHDKRGKIHYATNYYQHIINVNTYLK